MPLDTFELDGSYSFTAGSLSSYDGSYSFTITEAEYSEYNGTYAYNKAKGERYLPQVGYWQPFAQVVGNEFPPWHAARMNFFSRTQRYINILSDPLWLCDQKIQYERRNRFISTVDMFQPDTCHRIPVTVPLRIDNREVFRPKNLLLNSDFSIPGLARYAMPWAWNDCLSASTGIVERYEDNALVGTGCIRMAVEAGEYAYLRQNVQVTIGINDSVTASAWVLVPSTEETFELVEADRALVLTVLYADGTSETARVALPGGTNGAWKRIQTTIQPTKRVAHADFMITATYDGDGTYEVFVDACQLELGATATGYERSLTERPHWIRGAVVPAPYFIESVGPAVERTVENVPGDEITYDERKRYRVWVTGDQYDWWLNAVPTRVDAPVVDTSGDEANVRTRYGFYADPDDRSRRTTIFQISDDGSRIEWAVEETPVDVIFSYQIADHGIDGATIDEYGITAEEDETYSFVAEALTVHKDMVWVVGNETWNGVSRRILKVCLPFQRPDVLADDDQPNFLEAIQDYDLGSPTGTLTAIGFVEGDDKKLQLTVDGTDYVCNLWYDYAYFDRNVVTSCLLRHAYENFEIVMR